MSVKQNIAPPINGEDQIINKHDVSDKRRRFDRCFSFMEISIEPGTSSLKDLDSNKFKEEIKRWAKAVVAYARQVSGRLSGSMRSSRFGSSRKRSRSKSELGSSDSLSSG